MELTSASVRLPAALDPDAVSDLARALHDALAGPAPVVALVGAADDTFCLGLAIGATVEGPPPTQAFADLLATMQMAPKPLLAVVDGRAIGGGMGIACACDWVVATDRSTFALPELLWGLVPAIIWPVITDRMAPHVARQWTISAHTRPAAEGREVGLVDDLVPSDQLDRAVARATRMLRRLDPTALVAFRQWARRARHHDLPVALGDGAALTAAMMREPTTLQRWQAFTDGDTPWST